MTKFAVGDEVRVANDVRTSGVLNGVTGVVSEYDETGDVVVSLSISPGDPTPFGEDELELVALAKGGEN